MIDAEIIDRLRHAFRGVDANAYLTNADFHACVDLLAEIAPGMIRGLAHECRKRQVVYQMDGDPLIDPSLRSRVWKP